MAWMQYGGNRGRERGRERGHGRGCGHRQGLSFKLSHGHAITQNSEVVVVVVVVIMRTPNH